MKRKVYYKVIEVMDRYKIPIIVGLRRVGKTTILEEIQKEYSQMKSVFINFDDVDIESMTDSELKSYIENYIRAGYTLFLFDEIHVRENWDKLLKNLYDAYLSKHLIKIVVTGSSALSFTNKDTGVNRTVKIPVSTLDFQEYCILSGKEKTYQNFEKFLSIGGFPEYINSELDWNDQKNEVLWPIVKNDIIGKRKIDKYNFLATLNDIATLSNGEFNKEKLSKNKGIPSRQIETYINIMEEHNIIKKVIRVNESSVVSKYEKFKTYMNPHFHLWMLKSNFENVNSIYVGHIIESYYLFANSQQESFYEQTYYLKDSSNNEIDFVSINSSGVPLFDKLIEFKYSEIVDSNLLVTLKSLPSNEKILYYKGPQITEGIVKKESILDICWDSNYKG